MYIELLSYRFRRLVIESRLAFDIFLMRRRRAFRTVMFYALTLLLVLATAEGAAAVFFHYAKDRFTFYSFDDYLVPVEMIPKLASNYDFNLGWKPNFNTRHGERPRSVMYSEHIMTTYGDSFTYCAQVGDDETWQVYLSELLGKTVYNFGVGGYGTDQAYLRFKETYPKVKTRLATLALIGENICRAINVYRKFYFPKTGGPLTKPRFTLSGDGELVLLENPVKNAAELVKLRDKKFLEKIGEDDYWYNHSGYPTFSFPYLKIFFNRYFWLEVKYLKDKKRINDMVPRPLGRITLWKSDYAKIMFSIFDSFVKDAKRLGAEPIIMIIPMVENAVYQFKTGKTPENFRIIIEYCEAKGYHVFNAIDGLVAKAESIRDVRSFYNGHLSPKGNRLVAAVFYEFLRENDLI